MKTLFIGQNAIHLNAVGSTNSYASELLQQIKPLEGTLVYTYNQQNGRGQRGSTWESEANKNGAFSFILYPTFLFAEQQFILNIAVSLAVADLMTELLVEPAKKPEIRIKWPNDIYVDGLKVSGILIENTLREKFIQHAIIGIGINVNQTIFHSTAKASSLQLLANRAFDLNEITEQLCENMEARYLQLKAQKQDVLKQEYLQQLYQYNEWKTYSANGINFEGKITGVKNNGKLCVELVSSEVKEFDLKEVQFV